MRKAVVLIILAIFGLFTACSAGTTEEPEQTLMPVLVYCNISGSNIIERFKLPEGAGRDLVPTGSFGMYLRTLKLEPYGSKILMYDGTEREGQGTHAAIFSLDAGEKDSQQTADAMIRLYSEYLFAASKHEEIAFHLSNGFLFRYDKWKEGYRLKIDGDKAEMVKTEKKDESYQQFRSYLNRLFSYVSTRSLGQDLEKIEISQMQVGDILLQSGSPGGCAVIVDICCVPEGETYFLLACGGTPAQQIQILQNTKQPELYAWYTLSDFEDGLETPEFNFPPDCLYRFK